MSTTRKKKAKAAPPRTAVVTFLVTAATATVYRHPRVHDWRFAAYDDKQTPVAKGRGYSRRWSAVRGVKRVFPAVTVAVAAE